jgi:hypothetical protein
MNTEHKLELFSWTPVPNPGRRVRHSAVRIVLAGICVLVAWKLAQHVPSLSLPAFTLPTVAHVELPVKHVTVEEPPALAPPAIIPEPARPRGPVVRTISSENSR